VCWQEFWEPIVSIDGDVDLTLVKLELHDYHSMIQNVPKVFDHVTGGMATKPNTMAFEIIALADQDVDKTVAETIAEKVQWAIDDCDPCTDRHVGYQGDRTCLEADPTDTFAWCPNCAITAALAQLVFE
jgi:hypothetical protein